MVLDATLLNTQHYKVGIKGKCPLLHLGVVANKKRTFGSPSTTVANLTFLYKYNQNQASNDPQGLRCRTTYQLTHWTTNLLNTILGHIKTQFLPGSGCVDTAIWMHYMDAN